MAIYIILIYICINTIVVHFFNTKKKCSIILILPRVWKYQNSVFFHLPCFTTYCIFRFTLFRRDIVSLISLTRQLGIFSFKHNNEKKDGPAKGTVNEHTLNFTAIKKPD